MKNSQKGFVGVVVVIGALALLGASSYFAYTKNTFGIRSFINPAPVSQNEESKTSSNESVAITNTLEQENSLSKPVVTTKVTTSQKTNTNVNVGQITEFRKEFDSDKEINTNPQGYTLTQNAAMSTFAVQARAEVQMSQDGSGASYTKNSTAVANINAYYNELKANFPADYLYKIYENPATTNVAVKIGDRSRNYYICYDSVSRDRVEITAQAALKNSLCDGSAI